MSRAPAASPLQPFAHGVRLSVRLTPKASSDRLGGMAVDAAGRPALKVWVSAAPEDGKANAALIRLLAKKSRLPKSSFAVALGHAQRGKVIEIAGDPVELSRRLSALLGEDG